MSNYSLPKNYLSWSQYSLWKKDPNLYYQIYIDGMDMVRTPYLKLGTRLDEAIQKNGDEFNDPLINYLVMMCPRYPKMQAEIKVEFEGTPLFGKLDGFDDSKKNLIRVGEYKSGKKWTQGLVDKHEQLDFYALLVYLKYKKLPDEIMLHWFKTEINEKEEIWFTGDCQSFRTKRTMKDIILIGGRIKKVAEEISDMWKEFNVRNQV